MLRAAWLTLVAILGVPEAAASSPRETGDGFHLHVPPCYAAGYVGSFRLADNPGQLPPPGGQLDLGFHLGVEATGWLAVEFAFDWHGAELDTLRTPPPIPNDGAYEGKMTFASSEPSVSLKLFRRFKGYEPYVKCGVGWPSASLELSGSWIESVVVWPFIAYDVKHDASVTRHSAGLSRRVAAGINLSGSELPRVYLGLEATHTWVDGDLGALSGGEVWLGGWSYAIVLGTRGGSRRAGP